MFIAENETIIQSSQSAVWAAITNFDDYPKWHPFVRMTGSLSQGAKVDYSIRTKMGNARFRTVDAQIITLAEPDNFAVRCRMGHLFSLEDIWSLMPHSNGVRVVHGLRCTGLLTLLMFRGAKDTLQAMLEIENHKLARHLIRRSHQHCRCAF